MQRKPNLAIIGCRSEAEAIQRDLAELVQVQLVESDPHRAAEAMKDAKVDVALLFLDHEESAILELARKLSRSDFPAIVASASRDPDNILHAMRAGARDFAFFDEGSQDIARALRELPRRQTSAPPRSRGKVISVFGCKGGSGATTIALNLAGALMDAKGDEPAKVVVIDADAEMGDVLVFLDLSSKYTFDDVVSNMGRLDSDLLQQSLAVHRTGLSVLSQTDQVHDAPELTAETCGRVIGFLRDYFDFVVIDGLRDFRDVSLSALDQSDVILCTMTQDIPALKNVSHCLSIFKRLNYAPDSIMMVINRYRNAGKLTDTAIGDALNRRIDATIPNDYPAVIAAVNEGHLLLETDAKGKVYKGIQALVPLVYPEAAPTKRRSIFPMWGKR